MLRQVLDEVQLLISSAISLRYLLQAFLSDSISARAPFLASLRISDFRSEAKLGIDGFSMKAYLNQ